MTSEHGYEQHTRLLDALAGGDSSMRLKAALAIGTHPEPGCVDVLVARCAIEPDFFVRDMLTWALTRLPPDVTVPKLRAELRSGRVQARSQALHTLSKIGDRGAWPAITPSLLHDADDQVARSAWRAAVVLVPDGEREALAAELAMQLGRGDREVRLSLSRALVALGDVVEPVLRMAMTHHDPAVRAHADALRQVARTLEDPGFTPSVLVGDLIRETEERLKRAQELLERLRTVDATEPAGWPDVARIVELLHGLDSQSAARRLQAVLVPAEHASVPVEVLAKRVLTESDPNVAGAVRWALARAGGGGAASLASGIASADVDVRRRAVLALTELPGNEATAMLTDALRDTDATTRRHAALALGARGVTRAVPMLLRMVVEGPNDVEASELLGTFARDPEWADRIMGMLVDELAAHSADSAVRIRLTQALVEMPAGMALNVLRHLAHDHDRPVALIASALARVLEERPNDESDDAAVS